MLYENDAWVTCLCGRIPLNGPGQRNDVDGTVVFLGSEESRYITGQTLLIDIGTSTGATRETVARKKPRGSGHERPRTTASYRSTSSTSGWPAPGAIAKSPGRAARIINCCSRLNLRDPIAARNSITR